MTSAEFTESLAFEELEPDPAEVTMRLTASLLALMANVYRDHKKRPVPYDPIDFLPGVERPRPAPVDVRTKLNAVMVALGGTMPQRNH